MLYIWPLFAFFSLPLLLPYAVKFLDSIWSVLFGRKSRSKPASDEDDASRYTETHAAWVSFSLAFVVLSVAVVQFNTVIHPFTLADNRHYMFYVFRHTILREEEVRYALVAPYTLSRWAIWGLLSGYASSPAWRPAAKSSSQKAGTTTATAAPTVPTSTAILFLVTTTLSLVTAPLVEPRYFIVPWVLWRLMIPSWQLPTQGAKGGFLEARGQSQNGLLRFARGYDVRLILETLWFVAVNGITMAVFLFKPYQWTAEDGSLVDEGRLQRFMW